MTQIKIEENLILPKLKGSSKEEILAKMADNLCKHGYVKDSYKDAVIEREKNFATGLPTGSYGVAIPHTDIVHVNQAAISFAFLEETADFVIMGDEAETVPVKLVFMLAMKEQHTQLEMLKKLMGIFQDNEALAYLASEEDKIKTKEFMINKLNLNGGKK